MAVHVASLLTDPWAQLRLVDVVVPFGGVYRPVWVGFGTLAVDLLAAVTVSGLLRHRIGPKAFRAVHWATYVLWPMTLIHVLGAGTDTFRPWLVAVLVSCAVAVVAAVGWRISREFTEIGAPAGQVAR
ncbi:iron reductase [Nocardia sp. NPDC059091]|uniref:iron reductase n=1 Tax=unclassified Nocardia TaxID=2637762 RepID=UPI0036A37D15